MDKAIITVTHLGQDYSTISVNGEEFETSLGLGEAIIEAQKRYIITQSENGHNIDSTRVFGGRVYKVVDNNRTVLTTYEYVKSAN